MESRVCEERLPYFFTFSLGAEGRSFLGFHLIPREWNLGRALREGFGDSRGTELGLGFDEKERRELGVGC